MIPDDLRKPQLRALQYFYVDGTFEFGFGLLCLILAIFFYLEGRAQGWLLAVVDSSLVLTLIGGAWLFKRLVGWIKHNVTYPRTGYVAYPPKKGYRRGMGLALGMAAGGAAGGLAAVLAGHAIDGMAAMPVLSGCLVGLVLTLMGWRARLPRFYLLAGLSVAAGLALGWSGLENDLALSAYYLTLSLVLFASGALTLRAYLRSTDAPQPQ